MLNPKVTIDVTLHFEISNSEMYGGIDSIGYSSVKFGEVTDISSLDDVFVEDQIKRAAELLSVSQDDVRLISKEEFDQATEDSDDEYFNEERA